jgi:hypothetical protein
MATVLGFAELEFDLAKALLSSIIDVFKTMSSAPLLPANVQGIPEDQGVYQLLLNGKTVYIGKTDAEAGLNQRLKRHSYSIQHRKNLDPNQVSFKAVRLFVFTPMDLETQLIKTYEPAWNYSGFGSNDPGRNRDKTEFKEEGFDSQYPIDIDRELEIELPKQAKASEIAVKLRIALPYTFRFQMKAPKSRVLHPDFEAAQVNLPDGPYTTRIIIRSILQALPVGWQATALPSRVILYKETATYPSGSVIAATVA